MGISDSVDVVRVAKGIWRGSADFFTNTEWNCSFSVFAILVGSVVISWPRVKDVILVDDFTLELT